MERELIDWKVRPARRKLALPGVATNADGASFKILLSNISYEGCHLVAEAELSAGEVIDLDIPGMGRMPSQVRWADGGEAGVRFLLGQSQADNRRARIGV